MNTTMKNNNGMDITLRDAASRYMIRYYATHYCWLLAAATLT